MSVTYIAIIIIILTFKKQKSKKKKSSIYFSIISNVIYLIRLQSDIDIKWTVMIDIYLCVIFCASSM